MSDIDREEFNQWILDSEYALASPATRRWLLDAFQAGRASQGREAEPVAEVGDNHVLQWCPPYSRPPIGTKLFAGRPPAANQGVPDGWRVDIKLDGMRLKTPNGPAFIPHRHTGIGDLFISFCKALTDSNPPQPMEDE